MIRIIVLGLQAALIYAFFSILPPGLQIVMGLFVGLAVIIIALSFVFKEKS